jgi:hypothetical protein
MSDNTLIIIGVTGALYYYLVMSGKESQTDTANASEALNNNVTESSNDQDTGHDYKGNVIPEHQTFHTMPVESTPQTQPKSATM